MMGAGWVEWLGGGWESGVCIKYGIRGIRWGWGGGIGIMNVTTTPFHDLCENVQ